MSINTTTLPSGLVLLVEEIPSVASVALNWALPAGTATDPANADGHAALVSEFLPRGAGTLDSRAHSDALDRLGVQRSFPVRVHHMNIEASLLGSRLNDALPLLADVVRRPMFPADALPAVRSLCIQSLDGIDDDPQTRAMLTLRQRHIAPPFNRHGYGERAVLESATIDSLRDAWKARAVPGGSILAIAGAVKFADVRSRIEKLLGGWNGSFAEGTPTGPQARGYQHIEQTTAQVHIGLAWDAPIERDPDAMLERLGIAVLSGSTSGRLFTEVRQKRSLCYSVGASYRAGRDTGIVSLYAGTTPQRAQETVDVCAQEIRRMAAGATPQEFARAVIGLKSHLVMSGESTVSRAGALVHDYFRLGRARTLEELIAALDAITLDQLNAYLSRRVPAMSPITMVSIGPDALTPP